VRDLLCCAMSGVSSAAEADRGRRGTEAQRAVKWLVLRGSPGKGRTSRYCSDEWTSV